MSRTLGTHRAFIAALQRDNKWLVTGQSATQIQLSKAFGSKKTTAVSVLLEKTPSGMYTLEPLDHAFKSTASHFDYPQEERRWIRNKGMIKSLVKTLKRVKLWDGIEDKENFIQINDHNKKSNKKRLQKEFKDLV
jgi:hypothetical protein